VVQLGPAPITYPSEHQEVCFVSNSLLVVGAPGFPTSLFALGPAMADMYVFGRGSTGCWWKAQRVHLKTRSRRSCPSTGFIALSGCPFSADRQMLTGSTRSGTLVQWAKQTLQRVLYRFLPLPRWSPMSVKPFFFAPICNLPTNRGFPSRHLARPRCTLVCVLSFVYIGLFFKLHFPPFSSSHVRTTVMARCVSRGNLACLEQRRTRRCLADSPSNICGPLTLCSLPWLCDACSMTEMVEIWLLAQSYQLKLCQTSTFASTDYCAPAIQLAKADSLRASL